MEKKREEKAETFQRWREDYCERREAKRYVVTDLSHRFLPREDQIVGAKTYGNMSNMWNDFLKQTASLPPENRQPRKKGKGISFPTLNFQVQIGFREGITPKYDAFFKLPLEIQPKKMSQKGKRQHFWREIHSLLFEAGAL